MNSNFAEQKKQIRAELRMRLGKISPVEREEFSFRTCDLLKKQVAWKNAASILFYSPLPNELNVEPLLFEALNSGKIVLLPKFDAQSRCYTAHRIQDPEKDFAPGKFGIREPRDHCAMFPLNLLDLALVPGVGFDLCGRRLGRGRGFYDRLLSQVCGIKCGVCFDEQIVETIPVEPHDVRLNCILTPTRWQSFNDDAV